MLFNEPKLLKSQGLQRRPANVQVSVLFNEPKLLKSIEQQGEEVCMSCFSALQRAEIAEIYHSSSRRRRHRRFSALQRAEIAEMSYVRCIRFFEYRVSVLFNEPKLLKCVSPDHYRIRLLVSVLFNEPKLLKFPVGRRRRSDSRLFQCSSTSRNC